MLSEHDDGPKLADRPAKGPLVVPNPATGCSRPANAAALNGAIALIDSGSSCHPLEAVAYMEEAGAVAVIAVDPSEVWPPAMINGVLEGQVIPVVTVHRDDATLLTTQAVGRSVTLDGDATTYVGADAAGRLHLNATDPVVDGTSISHWDALARNQLLMEPERSAGHLDVDLTREFMWDLGWPICGDGVIQGLEACDDANRIDTDACHNDCTSASSAVVGTGGTSGTTTTPTTPTTDPKATSASTGGDKVSCSCRIPSSRTRRDGLGAMLALALMLRITRKRTAFGI
jgi:cysteine-rich repeat protein